MIRLRRHVDGRPPQGARPLPAPCSAWPVRQPLPYDVPGAMDIFDFDWLVIGSGFGGSVCALRLAEKGYSVGVLECGRRFADHQFPRRTADARRDWWFP